MKRFFVYFAVLTAMIFMVGCGGSDNSTSVCSYGEYECHGDDSYFCRYSGDDLMWLIFESCSNGCDYYSGRCSSDSNGGSGDNGSGNNSDGNSGDNSSGDTDPGNSAECTSGKFKCVGKESHYCNSNGSWVYDSRCEYGCDSSTGKCKTNSGNDDPDTSDSGDNGDSDHGDSSAPDTDSGGGSSAVECNDQNIGGFTCKTLSGVEHSYICSDNDFSFHKLETCKAGCDSSTGKCKPWKDPDSSLTWSSLKSYKNDGTTYGLTWDEAVSYCNNLSEGGSSNWRLPNIDELRTLIQNCPGTVTGGECGVTDSCLSSSECYISACSGCDYDSTGRHSKLGDTYWFWSSSVLSDNSGFAWSVAFFTGGVCKISKGDTYSVRCVR